jgi:hypothetical protein
MQAFLSVVSQRKGVSVGKALGNGNLYDFHFCYQFAASALAATLAH